MGEKREARCNLYAAVRDNIEDGSVSFLSEKARLTRTSIRKNRKNNGKG